MLDFHHVLKANAAFQETCRKSQWRFPPNASWMVYTDMVSHAVLSRQHALERTFIAGRAGLLSPERVPVNVLKRPYGGSAERRQSAWR